MNDTQPTQPAAPAEFRPGQLVRIQPQAVISRNIYLIDHTSLADVRALNVNRDSLYTITRINEFGVFLRDTEDNQFKGVFAAIVLIPLSNAEIDEIDEN